MSRSAADAVIRARPMIPGALFHEAILEILQEAVYILSEDAVILDLNPAAEKLFGYPASEMIGRPFTDFNPPEARQASLESFRRNLDLGGDAVRDIRVVRRDGSVAIADFRMKRVAGAVPVILSVGRDVTAERATRARLVESQDQLRHAQKMEALALLAGGVAHDFNNALTVINGFAELAFDALPEADPNRARLSEIRKAGERAADISRQLLGFSRKRPGMARAIDVSMEIGHLTKMLRRLLGEDVELVTEFAADLPPVQADPGQVHQVLMNLAVNARDAMPAGGRLTIATSLVGAAPDGADGPARVRLTVRDTGCGMDAATQARVFEPYFTTKPEGRGTGLGLAIVFGIIRDAGGLIAIESEVGAGTSFRIDLPAAVVAPSAAGTEVPAPGEHQGAATILYVEDDERLRGFAQDMLEARGHTVLAAGTGDEALEAARRHNGSIDLVVSDLVMPGLPTERMVAELRAAHPSLDFLFVSGYAERATTHPLLAGGAPFLEKPFTGAVLAAAVARVRARHVPAAG